MSLIVKMMSSESAADEDTRKSHRLYTEVTDIVFGRDAAGAFAKLRFGSSLDEHGYETFELQGNVYVMNEAGKTIDSFGVCPIPVTITFRDKQVHLPETYWSGEDLYQKLSVDAHRVLQRVAPDGSRETIEMGREDICIAAGDVFQEIDEAKV